MKKPTREELQAAAGNTIADIIGPDLRVLIVGINPSLYSGATGYHFARPGNRFWPAIAKAGISPRLLRPDEGECLLECGYGITNIVARATARADELSNEELIQGRHRLARKVGRHKPEIVAFFGISAFRQAWNMPKAKMGQQEVEIAGAKVWALPNPSGLNAHYQLNDLARLYRELHGW